MLRTNWTIATILTVVAFTSTSQPASAGGVVISGRTDVWTTAIHASGNENGNWTGEGVLALHAGGGGEVFSLEIQAGGEFQGIAVLEATATLLQTGSVLSVTIFGNPETDEWEIRFSGILWIVGYEPIGIGHVRIRP